VSIVSLLIPEQDRSSPLYKIQSVDKSFIGQEQSNSFSLQEVHLEQLLFNLLQLQDIF